MTNTKKLLGLVALSVWPSHAAEAPDGCFLTPTENADQYTYVPDCGDTSVVYSDFNAWYAQSQTCEDTYTDSGDGNYYMCVVILNTTIDGWQCNYRQLDGTLHKRVCDYHAPSPPPPSPPPPSPISPPPSPASPSPAAPPGPGSPCVTKDFDFTVSKADYDKQVLDTVSDDELWSYGAELAALVAGFFSKEFPASRLTLNPSELADFVEITEDGESDLSYVLEYTITCGPTNEATPDEAYAYLMERATEISIGSTVASGIQPRTRSTSDYGDTTVAPSPSPPPSAACIDFTVDRNLYTEGVAFSNGATYTKLYCYQLKNSVQNLCESEAYYIDNNTPQTTLADGEYKRCVPDYTASGAFRCRPSELVSTACAPSAPPDTSSSGLIVDSSSVEVNVEGDGDCMSDGAIAGVAIAMLLTGGVIGAVAIFFYVKKNAPTMAIKSPGV